ncbi:hypothetical protein DLAC_05741 [Tieghemostelium lacteum]|uniref:Transmembrane protein n=1 Tax=Tieghemostelium lacteum TaxID=361077 RepID=A0A151ZGX4_TIELA|nr:hypothetical protein DLAC_05741 [Tieghemostelium lacteum]|eukprot:KYQ93114.1 hypothetical protein DLAC_05741 [Tieghemostelium lacteum]
MKFTETWLPQQIPTAIDIANIITNGDNCVASGSIVASSIVIGSTVANTICALEIRDSVTVSTSITVYPSSLLNLNTSSIIQSATLSIRGQANNNQNVELNTDLTIPGSGSLTNNIGASIKISKLTTISTANGKFTNYGSSDLTGLKSNGVVNYTNTQSNILRPTGISGTIDVLFQGSSQFNLNNSTVEVYNIEYMELYGTSSLNINNSTFRYIYPVYDEDNLIYGVYSPYATSQTNVIDSTWVQKNSSIWLATGSTMTLTRSSLNIEGYSFNAQNTAKLFAYDSTLEISAFFFFENKATLYTLNTTINIVDDYFGIFDNAVVTLESSRMTLTNSNINETQITGLLNNATMFIKNSNLTLDADFLISDNSTMQISDSSTLYIEKEMLMSGDGSIDMMNNSHIIINNNMSMTEMSYFHTYSGSTIVINGDLEVYDQGDFTFQDSTVTITSSMILEATDYYSIINGSTVYVDGSFKSDAELQMINSNIRIRLNFSSATKLVAIGTSTVIESGNYVIADEFSGQASNFTLQNGNFKIKARASFSCEGCIINILQGEFTQGSKSNVNLVNTVFGNDDGKVETEGNILLQESGITNKGDFILRGDITADSSFNSLSYISNRLSGRSVQSGSYIVDNQGLFQINGVNKSTIAVAFKNSGGKLYVSQDSHIEVLEQTNGSIILDGKSLSTSQVVTISGGTLEGHGTVNAVNGIDNQANIGNNENVNKIQINGSLTQNGEQSSVTAYITEDDNTLISASEEVVLNGTLTVRIEDTVSDKNQTKQIITSNSQVTGQFKKINVVFYNKETKKETQPCKPIETEKTEKGFAVLLKSGNTPSSTSNCDGTSNSSTDNNTEEGKKSIKTPLIIGLVVGIVGLSAAITLVLLFKNRISTKLFFQKTLDKIERLSVKDKSIHQ